MWWILGAFLAVWASVGVAADSDITGKIRVIDGDTLRVSGQSVRLFGIDAPEIDQMCNRRSGASFDFGRWVKARVQDRYDGKSVRCTVRDWDRYGRPVSVCLVQGEDISAWLVQQGLAFAYRKYSSKYDLDEKGARVNVRGLHAFDVQSPAQFRKIKSLVPAPTGTCVIKGNISSKGTRIYHSPGQRDYDRTRINTAKGERMFCSSQEAVAAGWRAARR